MMDEIFRPVPGSDPSIPFSDLADHEYRQDLFLSWAKTDPILSRVPLVFVFEPNPVFAD